MGVYTRMMIDQRHFSVRLRLGNFSTRSGEDQIRPVEARASRATVTGSLFKNLVGI
jgi:hypothetical protein